MNLLTLPFRLPLLPVQGVIRLAQLIQEEAEREFYDPARVRHELEAVEQARRTGEMSDEEAARVEEEVVGRVTGFRPSALGTPAARGDEG